MQPGAGMEHAPGSGACALDEELHGVAVGAEICHILPEDRGVDPVSVEFSSQKEGAAVADQSAEREA